MGVVLLVGMQINFGRPLACLVSQPGVLCEGNARAITLSVGGQFVVVLGKNHRSPT